MSQFHHKWSFWKTIVWKRSLSLQAQEAQLCTAQCNIPVTAFPLQRCSETRHKHKFIPDFCNFYIHIPYSCYCSTQEHTELNTQKMKCTISSFGVSVFPGSHPTEKYSLKTFYMKLHQLHCILNQVWRFTAKTRL